MLEVSVGTLITVAGIGFASLILSKILEVAGQGQYAQYIQIIGVAGCAITVISIIVTVLEALSKLTM